MFWKFLSASLLSLFAANFLACAQSLQGRIVDARTGEPLPGVSITLAHTALGTLSDQQGRFALPSKTPGLQQLRLSHVGYETLETALDPATGPAALSLTPAFLQLHKGAVVTAQRYETPAFDRPETISVLRQQDLDRLAPRSTPEALTGLTGVWLQKTNHGGGSAFIRGLTGQQTLILVDGIRLNNATFRSGPNQYLNTLDPQSLAQVEVLRGAGSVQYGSDALGGVVQVFTKTPRFSDTLRLGGSGFAKYMSAGMEKSGRAELEFSSARVALLASFAHRDFGHLRAGGRLGKLRPTGYDQRSGDVKARFRLHDRYLLTAAWQQLSQHDVPVYHKVQLENFFRNQMGLQKRNLAYARLEAFYDHKWLRQLTLTSSRHLSEETRQSNKNNSPTRVFERDQVTTWGATLVAHSQPAAWWKMQSGLEYYTDRVHSSRQDENTETGTTTVKRGLYPEGADAASLALFVLNTLQYRQLSVSAGGRFQAFRIRVPESPAATATIRPSALVGSLSAGYALHPRHQLTAAVNTAFRAPNIDDMGTLGIVDFRYEVPNARLKPEKALNLEAGWKSRSSTFSSQLVFFRSHLHDLINRIRPGSDSLQGYPVYLKENTAKAYLQGFEAEAEGQLQANLAAYGSLVYVYGQNSSAGEPMRRIPPLHGRLGMRYQVPAGLWIRPESLFAGRQDRLAQGDIDDNRIADTGTPGWVLFNLHAGYSWTWLQLSGEFHNIGNKAYRTHGSGLEGYGRSAWLAMHLRF